MASNTTRPTGRTSGTPHSPIRHQNYENGKRFVAAACGSGPLAKCEPQDYMAFVFHLREKLALDGLHVCGCSRSFASCASVGSGSNLDALRWWGHVSMVLRRMLQPAQNFTGPVSWTAVAMASPDFLKASWMNGSLSSCMKIRHDVSTAKHADMRPESQIRQFIDSSDAPRPAICECCTWPDQTQSARAAEALTGRKPHKSRRASPCHPQHV